MKEKEDNSLEGIHERGKTRFEEIQSAVRDEREQNLEDRRFCTIAGAQWEGPLQDQYENKPKFEVNKIHLSVIRIINEYRNNRVSVDFIAKDKKGDSSADALQGIFRADEQRSVADEAYDNSFEEGATGGIGGWRLRAEYEDESDEENDYQRIAFEPIYDADSTLFFDLGAKRQDKKDAKFAFVLNPMTPAAYKKKYDDDPASWPRDTNSNEFDWRSEEVVYVAEYYECEDVKKKIFVYEDVEGNETRHSEEELEENPEIKERLEAINSRVVKERTIRKQIVKKYIMSGAKILEDEGEIAGEYIPLVPIYGKRWMVDNIERAMGHVRLAKDAQRLKNMGLSRIGEINALSPVEKPILTPDQVAEHETRWADDNTENYPYMLINPMIGIDGNPMPLGPIAYTRPPAIPPATAALMQITEQDIKDLLGNQGQGDEITSNISEKTVGMIHERLDMQTYIYMSNFAKGMKRCGEIWISMAKDLYVEEGRILKSVDKSGKIEDVELMKPNIDEEGNEITENDFTKASLEVVTEVGPSSSSKRQSTVRSLSGMMQFTQDPETLNILSSLIMMNTEGEGLKDIQEFYRKKLVQMGVVEPTKEDEERLQAEQEQAAQNQQPDPNTEFLMAEAEKAKASAGKLQAETIETAANTELTRAKTEKTLSDIDVNELKTVTEALNNKKASVQPQMNE